MTQNHANPRVGNSPAETNAIELMARRMRRERVRKQIAAVKRASGLTDEWKAERVEALEKELRRP